MTGPECSHERDVLDLVAMGQWPQRADASLREHVASCESCAEVAAISVAVREWSEAEALAGVTDASRVPDASIVWRRAQVRAREAAARTASRPVWLAQGAALVAFAAALAWIGPGAQWYVSVWQSVASAAPQMANTPAFSLWPDGLGLSVINSWGRTALLTVGGVALLASLVAGVVRMSERSE